MIKQIRTWCVITAKKKLSIKAHFLDPWSNTTDAHVTTFARQLDRYQVECEDHGVKVKEADKVDHFVYQMYLQPVQGKILRQMGGEQQKVLGGYTTPLHKAVR